MSGRTLLSCKFSLLCDETSTLYSPWPSLPNFSLMFIIHNTIIYTLSVESTHNLHSRVTDCVLSMLCLTEFVLKTCSRAASSEDLALRSLLEKQNKQQQQQKTFLSHHQDTSPAASDVCRANTPCRAFSFP